MIYDIYGHIGKVVRMVEQMKFREHIALPKKKVPGHTLYHFWGSTYSFAVRKTIYELGLDIPFKDVLLDKEAYADLVQLGGRDKVPCLRIETANDVKWMYESRDIISYLKTKG
jgi:hypothetical protein